MAVMHPELIMKSMIPVVMAGVCAIYGLVVAVLIGNGMDANKYTAFSGFLDLGAGLAVGLSGYAAGWATGITGDDGVRGFGMQPRLFVGMILTLVFAGVPGLYGLIVSLTLKTNQGCAFARCAPSPTCRHGTLLTRSAVPIATCCRTTPAARMAKSRSARGPPPQSAAEMLMPRIGRRGILQVARTRARTL